jgi:hypothetical protein
LEFIKACLKREGKGMVTHTDVIPDADLEKVGKMPCDTPQRLQFTIQFHFAKRAIENTHDMKKSDVIYHVDSLGKKYLKLTDDLTKNHRGNCTK